MKNKRCCTGQILQPRRLAYKLNQYNIPYTLSDALPNLFDHFAVRYVLDYMRIAMGDTSRATFFKNHK